MHIGDSEAFPRLQAIFKILRWKLNIWKYWRYRWICQTGQTVLWLCCAFTKLELDLSVNKCTIKCSINQYLQFLGRVQYFKNSFFSASDILNPTSKKFVKYMIFFRKSIAHQFLNLKHILCQDILELCLLEKGRFK